MIRLACLFVIGLAALAPAWQPQASKIVAIRGATVIPVTGAPPIPSATIVIRDDRIAAIGPAAVTDLPDGAHVIEAAGQFVVPGLIEMHAHLSKLRGSAMGLFVANGVTTLRDMGGDHGELLQWRREIRDGRRLGPRMVIAGPYLESARNIERMRKDPPEARVEPFERLRIPIGSPEEAARVVQRLAATELDFLKIRTVQNRETYFAINRAAAEHGLKLVGHVTGIPPDVVLEAGQDCVDHPFYPSADGTREERLETWRRFARKGVPIVPTLITLEASLTPSDRLRAIVEDDEGRIEPRRRYLSLFTIRDWREQALEASDERRAALIKLREVVLRDLREMHEAGMDILAGSDAAVINIYPGWSLHDEMAIFVKEIGMTAAEALERGTWRSARFLGLGDSIGTIERGKIADLVILDADPLADIANTRKIAAVVLRGVVYDRPAIARILSEVSAAPDRRKDDWGRSASRGASAEGSSRPAAPRRGSSAGRSGFRGAPSLRP
jgi:imidazolonepropionase-like amidohydrolase